MEILARENLEILSKKNKIYLKDSRERSKSVVEKKGTWGYKIWVQVL